MSQKSRRQTETRWPVAIAVIGLGGSSLALPGPLVLGPLWLIPTVVGALLVPTAIAHITDRRRIEKILGYGISVIVTLARQDRWPFFSGRSRGTWSAGALLRSAAILWGTNILVFAIWYWRLDAGGPHEARTAASTPTARFFPADDALRAGGQGTAWFPNFVDYLFLAFCTSTTLARPTTAILSRWAKLLTMIQARSRFSASRCSPPEPSACCSPYGRPLPRAAA